MLVVKIGGGKSIDRAAVVADLARHHARDERLVVVHGGAETTNEIAQRLGHPPQFVTSESGFSSRRTDRETLEIFEMVYCGLLNKGWVEALQVAGVNAVGLSGLDGRIFEGRRKDTLRVRAGGRRMILRDDWTGTVERINVDLLERLLGGGYLPVLTPPGSSERGEAINVDGDRAAAALAASLGADTLLILSNVPGLLERYPDEGSLIQRIDPAEIEDAMRFAEDRMKKKVLGACEAIRGGVRRVIFADGRLAEPIARALSGAGTHIEAAAAEGVEL
ncbi:MAG TPA: [LysW]-aminoadipate kinase [Thermoanaerobaculia bacterium]|nr:[LysW]-aminoadipate kinase [Thermoanaerobaculia bacterium]